MSELPKTLHEYSETITSEIKNLNILIQSKNECLIKHNGEYAKCIDFTHAITMTNMRIGHLRDMQEIKLNRYK